MGARGDRGYIPEFRPQKPGFQGLLIYNTGSFISHATGGMLFFRGTAGRRAMAGDARQGRRGGKGGGNQPGVGKSARVRPARVG